MPERRKSWMKLSTGSGVLNQHVIGVPVLFRLQNPAPEIGELKLFADDVE